MLPVGARVLVSVLEDGLDHAKHPSDTIIFTVAGVVVAPNEDDITWMQEHGDPEFNPWRDEIMMLAYYDWVELEEVPDSYANHERFGGVVPLHLTNQEQAQWFYDGGDWGVYVKIEKEGER